jgi:TorA maturation chaperone TorD
MPSINIEQNRMHCLKVLKTLCRIFWCPDRLFCNDTMNGDFVKLLRNCEKTFNLDFSSEVRAIERLAGEYIDSESLCASLSAGYIKLFVNDIDGIAAPLYQSCYQTKTRRLMGSSAINMKNRLEAHGLSILLPANEPMDHLCIELEYIYYLLHKGWSESDDDKIQEAVIFVRDSMIEWICRFCEKIAADGRFVFYMVAAELLCAIIQILSEMTIIKDKNCELNQK